MLNYKLETAISSSFIPVDEYPTFYFYNQLLEHFENRYVNTYQTLDQLAHGSLLSGLRDFTDLSSQDFINNWQQLARVKLEQGMCYLYTTDELSRKTPPLEQKTPTDVVPSAIRNNWQQLARAGLSEKSYRYILKLARKDAGWRGKGSLPMNSRSLAVFLKFWSLISQNRQEPEFVLMPNGNLQAEWYKDDQHFIELEFQPSSNILFGIFDGQTIMEGVAPIKEVVELPPIRNFKPSKKASLRQVA